MYEIKSLAKKNWPPLLAEIPDGPNKLYIVGNLPDPEKYIYFSVVGSRKYSHYGKDACRELIHGLASYPVAIVSGLALGIDSIAHQAALEAGLPTIAVPGSGLGPEVLYPPSNRGLAEKIVASGGCLLSEFECDFRATPYSFPQRNRLMAGMSPATLIVEATAKSGTLITARLALDYNREVLVVPGPIFNDGSTGTLNLLKDGARPVTTSEDILDALEIKRITPSEAPSVTTNFSPTEKLIYELLMTEPLAREDIIIEAKLSATEASMALSLLEIKGLIEETGGEFRLTR
ncbi:MAG: DNA protecting protein DprA [Candidatus Vogelbacteria bacterium RIFOXYD1_FULL_44_32]|uniref:DNA protecting protein DprA n=1 Tax=Candidatus Vogelbacteria bacterium RIFOXYD1_FULL_44_32 TaxID=1802438 RepID=A0A1G2QEQ7_9BACT|nr:MAG: DNA protecting protein DprA [Candidatus Vogelbacteria bacterium RIFOXYD1_FULL_44_32]